MGYPACNETGKIWGCADCIYAANNSVSVWASPDLSSGSWERVGAVYPSPSAGFPACTVRARCPRRERNGPATALRAAAPSPLRARPAFPFLAQYFRPQAVFNEGTGLFVLWVNAVNCANATCPNRKCADYAVGTAPAAWRSPPRCPPT